MTDYASNYSSRRKHIREPPAVPFLWEDRPGLPKKDWKPPLPSVTIPDLPPPVKLIASVPFIWEEKPGTPLPSFSDPTPVTQMHSQWHTEHHFEDYAQLENSLKVDLNGKFENPKSPPGSETDSSSTSSYATGISSLTGSTFLERLFPLYMRNSSFPGDCAFTEESNHYDDDVARRTITLGELIMMSRRMSCQRKTVQTAKHNLSMEFIKKKAFGCCIFGVGIHMLEGFQRKRQHLLKLL